MSAYSPIKLERRTKKNGGEAADFFIVFGVERGLSELAFILDCFAPNSMKP
jgi:hypothetical protein